MNKIIQTYNPRSKCYIKINTAIAKIISSKKTPYKNIKIVPLIDWKS